MFKTKVYRKHKPITFDYPEDMATIMSYLNSNGRVLVGDKIIEKLYREFSEEKFCAGWMSITDEILSDFEHWLDNYDA